MKRMFSKIIIFISLTLLVLLSGCKNPSWTKDESTSTNSTIKRYSKHRTTLDRSAKASNTSIPGGVGFSW